MYNMEIYCTRPYCIENPYWTRRLWRLVQYGFSIQYRLVQYLSTLYIIYFTRPYCIENPYWTRRLRRLVQYGFSIHYRLVQYLSILYITLYNNLSISFNHVDK